MTIRRSPLIPGNGHPTSPKLGFGDSINASRGIEKVGFRPYNADGSLIKRKKKEPEQDVSDDEMHKRRLEQIERQVYQKVFKEAEQAGLEAGMHKMEQTINTLLPRLDQMTRQLDRLPRRIFELSEQFMVEMAITLVKELLQHELTVNTDSLVARVNTLLNEAEDRDEIVLHVPPEEAEVLARLPNFQKLKIVAEQAMEPGTVRLQTDFGGVEENIASQLVAVEEGLRAFFTERNKERAQTLDQLDSNEVNLPLPPPAEADDVQTMADDVNVDDLPTAEEIQAVPEAEEEVTLDDLPTADTMEAVEAESDDITLEDLPTADMVEAVEAESDDITLEDLPTADMVEAESDDITLEDLPTADMVEAVEAESDDITLEDLPTADTMEAVEAEGDDITLEDLPTADMVEAAEAEGDDITLDDLPTADMIEAAEGQSDDITLDDIPTADDIPGLNNNGDSE
ncbi:MAG: hypothetical protein HQL54_04030 [Magnetococcales bacterium]|nr:hypothetical protein [Magnetococcales bacterium]